MTKKTNTSSSKEESEIIVFSKDDFLLQKKLENATEGIRRAWRLKIASLTDQDKLLIADFINDFQNTENIRFGTRRVYLMNLFLLIRSAQSRFDKEPSVLKAITKADIEAYLYGLRKSTITDPDQGWISTYNQRLTTFLKFYKWLNYRHISPSRLRPKPALLEGIPFLQRKELTPVKASDLWTQEEDKVFLKYCDDDRMKLFHTMADDTSARPHELLALRIGDVKIKNTNGRIYGEVEIGRGGKTKSRTVPLIISLPYFKALLLNHPEGSNPNSFIFRSIRTKDRYTNKPITPGAVNSLYGNARREQFPKLLERPDVPPEDKIIIKEMLAKPWNPYLRRHISLTEKARLVNEYTLRQHAGWTKTSQMVRIYTHELGGESSRQFLKAYGILPEETDQKLNMPKYCPNCNEPNKPDARFCINQKCNLPLTFDAYAEAKEKELEKENKVELMQEQMVLIMSYLMEKDPEKKAEISRNLIEKGYMPKNG